MQIRIQRLTPITLLTILLAACELPFANHLPTPMPEGYLPTAVGMTMTAYAAGTATANHSSGAGVADKIPSSTPSPSATASILPFISSPTATSTPFSISPARIKILSPGPLSKVISPIDLRANVIPGYKSRVRVELTGEDGRLLERQILPVYTSTRWAYLAIKIPFEIRAAAELARLQISTEDEFGHATAVMSVHLLLLSEGFNEYNPPGPLDERCIITSPTAGGQVSDDMLIVEGRMRPFNSQPLVIELITPNGAVVGARMVPVEPTADGGYVSFIADIPYQVHEPTWVLLTLRQSDDRIDGMLYLYSQELLLNP